ncbi:barstar family protein [Planctomonas sp. JC2975]|uniref:barstar family protein n=1 Tax=Planctomonas sp. JC2975 TaxID=2729626 RepID=UPI001472DB7A|nr:barstar family protein [Planctomonas sp. JC2975]
MMSSDPVAMEVEATELAEIIEDRQDEYQVIWADGRKMQTKVQLMEEISQAFGFPSYFGRNWDALDEVLRDSSWRSDFRPVLFILQEPSAILKCESVHQFDVLLDVLSSAAKQAVTAVAGGKTYALLYPVLLIGTGAARSADLEAANRWRSRGWSITSSTS